MGKLDDALELYNKEMTDKLGIKKVDQVLLRAAAKACGPALYKKDASKVACSNKDEMERIRQNFLIKKLGLKDTPKLEEGLKAVCQEMGSRNRNKYRAIFYYLLIKKFRKSSMFKQPKEA